MTEVRVTRYHMNSGYSNFLHALEEIMCAKFFFWQSTLLSDTSGEKIALWAHKSRLNIIIRNGGMLGGFTTG